MASQAEVRSMMNTLNTRARNLEGITTIGSAFNRAATSLQESIDSASRAYGYAVGRHGGPPPGVPADLWSRFYSTITHAGNVLVRMRARERDARAAYESGERSTARGQAAAAAGETYAQYAPSGGAARRTTTTSTPTTTATTSVTKPGPAPGSEAALLPAGSGNFVSRALSWLNPPARPVYQRPAFIGAAVLLTAGLGYAAYQNSQKG